ncbi:MAG TPA: ATPase, T2SS/T4P/T4SS family, partial [Candidatus Ozemobacteraceae bacterium]|nr:ATPase, T2SS/T4P/T4SS family [Candidatus Ozemobacteraceae bacterium]
MEADLEFMEQMLSRLVQLEPGCHLHLEPFETEWLVRLSDGRQMTELAHMTHHQGIMLAQFLLKGADIFEQASKLPATGALKLSVGEREQWLQVSSTPVIWGAKLVVGIMQTVLPRKNLDELGLEQSCLEMVQRAIAVRRGVVIVGGRSRSGRSTTERAMLSACVTDGMRGAIIEYADQGPLHGVESHIIGGPGAVAVAEVMRSLRSVPIEVIGTSIDSGE